MTEFVPKPNPFMDPDGFPLEGKEEQAIAFAKADFDAYFDALPPDEQKQVMASRRNFQAHVESSFV